MAERWAVANGNSDATATWNGGTLPTSDDDVYANGYAVTVNTSTSWKTVRTTAGTTAVAGGGFTLSNSVTLTLTGSGSNVIAGSSICVIYSGTSGNTATLIGNITGSSTNTGAHGALNGSTGTLNVIGNVVGGGQGSTQGVRNNNTGTIHLTGNVTGGTSNGAHGLFSASSSSTITVIGDVIGGTHTQSAGLSFAAAGSAIVTGNAIGGVAGPGAYIASSGSTAVIVINGDAIGGAASTSYGVLSVTNTTGTITVTGVTRSGDGANIGPGAAATGTVSSVFVNTIRVGTSCGAPLLGKVAFSSLSTASVTVLNAGLETQTLTAGSPKSVFAPPSVFGGVA